MDFLSLQVAENNLKIQSQIGFGSTAKVYLALDAVTKKKYALKIFSKRVGAPKIQKDIFKIEQDIMEGISHQNICCLKGAFKGLFLNIGSELVVGDTLILELAEQGNLTDALRNHKLNQTDKIIATKQLIEGLKYLHQNNYAHNDLKPDNIALATGKQLKIIDFSSATQKGYMDEEVLGKLGSKGYIAPELLTTNDFSSIDRQKCDMYSLGMLIFYIFLDRVPFTKPDQFDFFYREVIHGNIDMFWEKIGEHIEPLKSDKNFNIQQFKELLGNLICFNPKERQTCEELLSSDFFNVVKY